MDNINVHVFWKEFKEFMVVQGIDQHTDTMWRFFEDHDIFVVNDDTLSEAHDNGYNEGFADAEAYAVVDIDDAYDRGYDVGYNDARAD